MTLAPESIFTFYSSEMDQQVNNSIDLSSSNSETPLITWHSLPKNPETLPEIWELILMFQQAAGDICLLKEVAFIVREEMKADKQPEWLNSSEVIAMLRISKRTLQQYRNKKSIDFTKIGGRIYYNRRAVMRMMEHG
jgi:hypothetical protein